MVFRELVVYVIWNIEKNVFLVVKKILRSLPGECMDKAKIRQWVLNHYVSRELFFFLGRRKTNLRKIDKALKNGRIKVSNKKAVNVIVSLTSYGERISELKYTLYSLIKQNICPEKIIVNIAFEDEKYITSELRSFEQYGVEFFLCKDLRSYKKLLPTLERFPQASIVTCDDDIYYEKNWLKRLYLTHKQFPEDICCHFVKKITHEKDTINTYHKWIHNYKCYTIDNSLFLLGATGVFYPSGAFFRDIDREDLFMKLAPLADDIWFWFMIHLNGKSIRQIKNPLTNLRFVNPYREYGISEGETLTKQNVGQNKNDIQFHNILTYYGIAEKTFIKFLDGDITTLLQ